VQKNIHVRDLLPFLICIMVSFFICYRLFQPKGTGWKTIITSDGRGYYAYLPAILLYGDLSFQQVTKIEKKSYGRYDYLPEYLVGDGDKVVNKYVAGEALLLLPFFLLAIFFSWVIGLPLDGYSFFFQLFTGLGALFYTSLGLLFLRQILRRLEVSDRVIAWVLTVILLGTNLFYYTIWQATMSHPYSFCAINGFLLFVLKAIEQKDRKHAFLSGLFLGLVILIRPVNGLVIFLVPFLCATPGNFRSFLRYLFSSGGAGFFAVLIPILFIQLILWYIQTGRWLIWSYPNEGFYFNRPEIAEVLLGYRKGLFVYTPVLALSILGLFTMVRSARFRLIVAVLFLCLMTYVSASWWNWYFGDGFGMRPFIDVYGLFAILLAFLLNAGAIRKVMAPVGVILVVLIFFNLFQTWQYLQKIIHPFDMDHEKYSYVFFRTDSAYMDCLGGNREAPFYGARLDHPYRKYINDFEKKQLGWNDDYRIQRPGLALSGKFIGPLDSLHEFSPGLEMRVDSFCPAGGKIFCTVTIMVNDSLAGASNGAFFVTSIDHIDKNFNYWYGFKLNDIPQSGTGIWRSCTFAWNLPEIKNPAAMIKMYVWNPFRKPFMIDDFRIELFRGMQVAGIKRKN